MCRWLAYSGAPIYLEELILKPEHSLIDQSRSARSGSTTTNADGFGVGWYGDREAPGLYRDVHPAWNDPNLRDLSRHIESPMFLAHVRTATGSPVQNTNCHPFRSGRWLFVHNGAVDRFPLLRRDLALAIAPERYADVEGSTDTETMFHLALTMGLADDPIAAVERMAGFIEQVGRANGVEFPLQMTLGISDGERVIGIRYSSEHSSPSLFISKEIDAVRELHPDLGLMRMGAHARVVVSEPLSNMTAAWQGIPDSTAVIVHDGDVEIRDFTPRPPAPSQPDRQRA